MYIVQIVFLAFDALYYVLADICVFPAVGTITAVDTFLGVVLKISSDKYYKGIGLI